MAVSGSHLIPVSECELELKYLCSQINSISSKIEHASKKYGSALDGVAQWTECQPAKQRVASSITNQGTWLGCRPGPH